MKRWAVLVCAFAMASAAWGQIKVVYHLNEGIAQATRAIVNIRNHLSADPTVKIVVVAHGAGIDFLIDGARNTKGELFAGDIGDLASRGVEFRVCNNTMMARNITASQLALEATVVPSGVAEVARLQAREGCVYFRP